MLLPTMALALLAGGALTDCAPSTYATNDDGGVSGPRVASYISITPDNDVLQVDLNMPGSTGQKTYTVRLVYSDGSSDDITSQVTLMLDDPTVGSLSGNTFTAAAAASARIAFTRITTSFNSGGQNMSGVANLTVVWLRTSGAATDFFFELPYNGAAQNQPLKFNTNIQSLDAFFAVDTTSSMTNSIVALRDSLQNTIIPGVKSAAAKDAWFGVGAVEDFPANNNGAAGCGQAPPGGLDDQAFILLNGMATDPMVTQNNVTKLLYNNNTRGCGGDIPEGQIEALYQIATGKGNIVGGVSNIASNKAGIGGVGFRKGALPVVTMVTDAMFHTKGEGLTCVSVDDIGFIFTETSDYVSPVLTAAHSRIEMTAALQSICAKVVGVAVQRASVYDNFGFLHTFSNGGYCPATNDLVQVAQATGSVVPPEAWDIPARPAGCAAGKCCTGLNGTGENPTGNGLCPLVFKLADNGSGMGAQVTSGIANVARYSSFTVTTSIISKTTGDSGEMLPTGKTTADFISMITPYSSTPPPAPPTLPGPMISGGSFTTVYPGSTVSFTVFAQNTFVAPTTKPQVFRATIQVLAGGCAELDQREVIILVPPQAPTVG